MRGSSALACESLAQALGGPVSPEPLEEGWSYFFMRVCGRLNTRDRAPLPAQAANLVTVSTMALLGMVRPTLFLKPGSFCVGLIPGPERSELTMASDGPRWLGCASEAPGPSQGWAFVINESRPPSCQTPAQPGFRP